MATRYVYKDAYLSVGGNDISDYVKACTLNASYDEVDAAGMGDGTHYNIPGLGDWSIDVELHQSWANTEVDSILWPYLGNASVQAIILKPNGDTTSTSNPKWTANGRIFAYPPMGGSVGDGASASFTIKPGDGTMIARATSD